MTANLKPAARRAGRTEGNSISFWTTSACILVAVLSALLAIWKFAGTDILWRTVATCAVIGSGTVAFYWINVLFGKTSD